eukprot:552532-Heterocapsa_arctica.AAC.2
MDKAERPPSTRSSAQERAPALRAPAARQATTVDHGSEHTWPAMRPESRPSALGQRLPPSGQP